MSPQTRIHDYRGPRSTADLNRKVVGILQPGVYEGFSVSADGTISPGVLLTAQGVRIEEDQPVAVAIPPNTYDVDRQDLVVCSHEYVRSVPVPHAVFEVLPGNPDGSRPELTEEKTLIALTVTPSGQSTFSTIIPAGKSLMTANIVLQSDFSWKIIDGSLPSVHIGFDRGTGDLSVQILPGGSVQSGETFNFEPVHTVFTLTDSGILQLIWEAAARESKDTELENLITGHMEAEVAAHPASSIVLDPVAGLGASADLQAAIEVTTQIFGENHRLVEDPSGPAGTHKTVQWTGGSMKELFCTTAPGTVKLRSYWDAGTWWVTINSSWDDDEHHWVKDLDIERSVALMLHDGKFKILSAEGGATPFTSWTEQAVWDFSQGYTDHVHHDLIWTGEARRISPMTVVRTIPACMGVSRTGMTGGAFWMLVHPTYWENVEIGEMYFPVVLPPGSVLKSVYGYGQANPGGEETNQLAMKVKKVGQGAGGPVVSTLGSDSSFGTVWGEYRVDGLDEEIGADSSYLVEWAGTFSGAMVGGIGVEVERKSLLS
jgi:hypothetical protein